jgi:hypothetical protein
MAGKRGTKKTANRKSGSSKTGILSIFSGKRNLAIFAAVFALVGIYAITRAYAATGQIYITPETTTIPVGEQFKVSVRITPGTAVDAVQFELKYDPTVMEFVSIDGSTSPFTSEIQAVGGSGSVKIARGTFSTGVNIDALVSDITFKALTANAASPVTLTGNATVGDTLTDPTLVGATVTVVNPTPPPTPGDTTAPAVTISSPTNGARPQRGKFQVRASATDVVGVTRMEVYIDNSIRATVIGSTVSYDWAVKSKKIPNGEHTITVKAYDAAGNVGSSSVTVVK